MRSYSSLPTALIVRADVAKMAVQTLYPMGMATSRKESHITCCTAAEADEYFLED
jgi:hypothetical protein